MLSIKEYYQGYVVPLDKRFKRFNFQTSKTVVCPLHNDNDPSLGVLPPNKRQGRGERFHCFGCGKWGDLLDLHVEVQRIWYGKTITRAEAAAALGIQAQTDTTDPGQGVPTTHVGRREERSQLLETLTPQYNYNDYKEGLLKVLETPSRSGRAAALQTTWLNIYWLNHQTNSTGN